MYFTPRKNLKMKESPLDLLFKHEKDTPQRTWFYQPLPAGKSKTWTWKEGADEVRRLAGVIQAYQLPPNSCIALVSKNCAYWIIADLAIMMSGHISVPLYPNVNAETLHYILEHSETKLLLVGKLDSFQAIQSGIPNHIPCIGFPDYCPNGLTNFHTLAQNSDPIRENIRRNPTDIMTIIYTSGTTGKPKGVVHTFHNFTYAINHAISEINIHPQSRFFSYLPLSHIAERMLIEMGSLVSGGQIFFAESLDTFARDLQFASPTVFLGVPRIWTKFQMGILSKIPQKALSILLAIPIVSSLLKNKIKKGLGLHQAEYCCTGAAPTPPALIHWYKKLGIELQEVYGMTENVAYSHFTRQGRITIGSAGQPMPHVQVKFTDNGELCIRHEAIMSGYYKDPQLTDETIIDGWLHTGDCAHQDAQGFLFITGRVKEIFKTEKGKYVSPSPIEMQLAKNANIEQVCVVGDQLPQPIALVVLSADARTSNKNDIIADLQETLEIVNNKLEKHEKLQKMVVVKDEWTVENDLLTPTMKIKRNLLETKYKAHYTKWYNNLESIILE